MIRSIALFAATAALASVTVLGAACGGSTARGTSADGGGGSDATSDAPKHAETGAGGDSGDDGGAACALSASAVAPHGTQLVASNTAAINGVTSDGYVVYTDTTANVYQVVSLAGGTPTMLSASDGTGGTFASGPVAFAFNAVGQTTGVGTFAIWTSAHGLQSIGTAVIPGNVGQGALDLSSDGTHIVYFDNAAGNTGDVTIINTDGTGKTVLAPGLDLTSMTCFPAVYFAGAYVVIETCAVGSDGGNSSTLTSYTGTGWAMKATLSTMANGSANPVADPTGATLLYSSASGLQVATLATGLSVTLDPAGTAGTYTSDGQHVVYSTSAGGVGLAAITGGTPIPLLAGAGYQGVLALSPDNNWLVTYKTAMQDSAGDIVSDLYLASAATAGSATALASTATASVFGDIFTTDSSHATFTTAVANGSGTLTAAATMGGTPATLGMLDVFNLSATGAKVVFNVNDTSCGNNGAADLEVVDTSTTTPATLLVTQADPYFYLDKAKDKVVYSWSYVTGSTSGIWVLPLP